MGSDQFPRLHAIGGQVLELPLIRSEVFHSPLP